LKVLLTCAGRRNYLVRYFREAVGNNGKVFAADNSETASALQEADRAFIVPPVSAANYTKVLREICEEQSIKLIVPLNDLELPILAAESGKFSDAGAKVLISPTEIIEICLDKWKTYCFLRENHIPTPVTYLSLAEVEAGLLKREVTFPLVLKPRWGTASLYIHTVNTIEELRDVYALLRKLLPNSIIGQLSCGDLEHAIVIQEALDGVECGMDILNNLSGQFQGTVARQKISMRAGETDRAITLNDESLRKIGRDIGEKLHHIGNVDCDVFLTDSGPVVLEMNPRFGGGYPFSHEAGANFPAIIIAWISGQPANPAWLETIPDLVMSKYELVKIHKRNI